MDRLNKLVLAGWLSISAALLHVAIIIAGSDWYRFFGAGEELATLAGQGSRIPTLITLGIATVLFVWGLYAFAGAHAFMRLPILRVGLTTISAIYLVRGLAVIPALFLTPIDSFVIWNSIIRLSFGRVYATGTIQQWSKL